ncbi:MAG TPA: hypothetical protein VKP66_18505 [Steroidobacteraceae bacterium]|nr:hypothetical protein [Steroidobacteraceae bacterium]
MNSITTKFLSATVIVAALAGAAGTASADTAWQKNHPRREEVNNRLANQNARIHRDVKDGTLTRGQAAALHHQDRQIRQEERDMASQNGGHITKSEKKVLNQQENGVSREIPPK